MPPELIKGLFHQGGAWARDPDALLVLTPHEEVLRHEPGHSSFPGELRNRARMEIPAHEPLTPRASMDRLSGWATLLKLLGSQDSAEPPQLFIHRRCRRLLSTLPLLQHDPDRPEDVLKVDASEDGAGGDDAPDALRYLVISAPFLPPGAACSV